MPVTVADWLDFMSDTVTITPYTGKTVSGSPTFNTSGAVDYPAYIEMKNHIVVDHLGREVMAKGRVFLGTTVAPSIYDKITLPVGFTPREPPVLCVNLVNDENGTHHITIEIG